MKRIVITGASSGLGREIALRFLEKGWRVGVAARRRESLEEIAALYPGRVETAAVDIAADDAPERILELIERLGGVDIFLQGAGVGKQNVALDPEIERMTVRTNCVGFAAMMDTAFNYMASHGGGHIAAITSVAGTRGLGAAPSYSASKRFGSTYIEALDQLAHIRGVNISFTDLRPGFIDTPLLDSSTHYPGMMTMDHAVPLMVKAILRRKRVAIIDWRWWWIVQAWRRLPGWMWRRIKATTKN